MTTPVTEPTTSSPTTTGEPRAPDSGRHWRIAVVLLGLLVVVGVVVVLSIPGSGRNAQQSTFEAVRVPAAATSAADLQITIDSIDPAGGTMRARFAATTTDAAPPSGVTVLTSIPGASTINVRQNDLVQEKSAPVSFTNGDNGDYPFDVFRAKVEVFVVKGTNASIGPNLEAVPFELVGNSTLAGMNVSSRAVPFAGHGVELLIQVERSAATKGWVLAMMAIYWAIALLVAGVTSVVIRRRRTWALLLLSWLSATVFALISFRSAAPGAPPVGTFLDFYAVFESVGIVAVCLIVLLVYYLVQRRSALE